MRHNPQRNRESRYCGMRKNPSKKGYAVWRKRIVGIGPRGELKKKMRGTGRVLWKIGQGKSSGDRGGKKEKMISTNTGSWKTARGSEGIAQEEGDHLGAPKEKPRGGLGRTRLRRKQFREKEAICQPGTRGNFETVAPNLEKCELGRKGGRATKGKNRGKKGKEFDRRRKGKKGVN